MRSTLIFVAASLAACTAAPKTAKIISQKVTAAAGGTVTAAGAVLNIPPGALSKDTTITVAVSDKTGQPAADTIAASVFDYGPNGTTFATPVELAIDFQGPIPSGKSAVVAFLDNGVWSPLADSTVSGTTVTAHTTHFTLYTVVFIDSVQATGTCSSSFTACGGNLTGTWSIGIACANVAPADAPIPNCPGSTVTVTATPTGTISFDQAAGAYSQNAFDVTLAYAGTFPTSCAPNGDCAATTVPQGTTATSSGGACSLSGSADIHHGAGPQSDTGTLTVTGDQFQTQSSTDPTPNSPTLYCVSGNTLNVQLPAGSNGSTIVFVGTKQ